MHSTDDANPADFAETAVDRPTPLTLGKPATPSAERGKKILIGLLSAAILALPAAWLMGFNFNRALALVFGTAKPTVRGQSPLGTHAESPQSAAGAERSADHGSSTDDSAKLAGDAQDAAAEQRNSTASAAESSSAASGAAPGSRSSAGPTTSRRRLALKPADGDFAASDGSPTGAQRSTASKAVRKPVRDASADGSRSRPASVAGKAASDSSARQPKLDRPRLTLLEQVNVPALQAGELQSLNVHMGDDVTKGELLAQINDKEQQVIARKAEAERRVAQEKFEESVDIEFAEASRKVAEAELEFHKTANRKGGGGVVTEIELMKDQLNVDKSRLQKKKAEVDKTVDGLSVDVKRADEDGAKLGIERRQIVSPLEGQVVKIMRHAGEWVAPGDPVFRVIRLDRLRVDGELNVSDVDPRRISKGTPVAVTASGLDGKPLTVRGVVTFVSQEIGAGGDYQVVTEIDNIREGDHWTIYPGMPDPQVTILLGEPLVRTTAGAGVGRGR